MSSVFGYIRFKHLIDFPDRSFQYNYIHQYKQYYQEFSTNIENNFYKKETPEYYCTLFGNISITKSFNLLWNNYSNFSPESFQQFCLDLAYQINGIYAITLYHKKSNCLYLISDAMGFYPMYYYFENGELLWFSDQKDLRTLEIRQWNWNEDAIESFIQNGHLLENQSWHKEIKRTPPGTILCFDLNNKSETQRRYWSWEKILKNNELKLEESIEKYYELIVSSLDSLQSISYPLGLSLSGGLDSRLIATILKEMFPYKSFTFSEENSIDLDIAQRVSRNLNIEHRHFEILYDNWVSRRCMNIWKTSGMLSMEHLHEGDLFDQIHLEFPQFVHGFYGGGIYAGKAESNKRIDSSIAEQWIKDPKKIIDVNSDFYNIQNIDCFIVNQRMRNSGAFSLYYLAQYSKVIIPFYNLKWLEFNYSLDDEWQLNNKFYFQVLDKKLPKELKQISWQKTGIPVDFINMNIFALSNKLNSVREKVFNKLGHSTLFVNYKKVDAQIELQLYQMDYKSITEKRMQEMSRMEKMRVLTFLLYKQMLKQNSSNVL